LATAFVHLVVHDPFSTGVPDLTAQLQSPPNRMNRLRPEDLMALPGFITPGVIAYSALSCQSQPLRSTSLFGYTSGLCHTGPSWLGPRPSLFHCCSVSPCHPPSTPGTPAGARTQFFPADTSLRPSRTGSATPFPLFALSTLTGSWWSRCYEAQSVRYPLRPGDLFAS